MFGPTIIERTLSVVRPFGSGSNRSEYQYHPRSDHHSKLACWCIAFDLLSASSALRRHVELGKVRIGVNHEMLDFKNRRKKNLDLVIGKPSSSSQTRHRSLACLAKHIGVMLEGDQQAAFDELPQAAEGPIDSVLVALEAKACMTEHTKSLPRLFDELNSSQQTVHGANDAAIACGLVMINASDTFLSPGRQRAGSAPTTSRHRQPDVANAAMAKVRELPRRTQPGVDGFDALGTLMLSLRNDGSPVSVLTDTPAAQRGDGDTYDEMVLRVASLYDYRFAGI